MAKQPEAAAAPRFTTKRIQVTIDQRPYPVVSMNVYDVLISGAPDWIVPGQRIDIAFLMLMGGKESIVPTYGAVVKNDAAGLEIRYQPPNARWREFLARVITEENAQT
jgi:hypothetical protein